MRQIIGWRRSALFSVESTGTVALLTGLIRFAAMLGIPDSESRAES
jgi:hypothetical protein